MSEEGNNSGIFRGNRENLLESIAGLLVHAHPLVGPADIDQRYGVGGIEFESLGILGDGDVEAPGMVIGLAQSGVQQRADRIQIHAIFRFSTLPRGQEKRPILVSFSGAVLSNGGLDGQGGYERDRRCQVDGTAASQTPFA